MRHGPKVWTEKVVTERLKAGLGAGAGDNYRPWHAIQDLSSRGRQTRIPLFKQNRVVHTHSYIERAFVLLAEFQPNFHGLQDQKPIPREVTLAVAERLGIRHPTYPISHVPVVMTNDFVVSTVDEDGVLIDTAWDCKREAEANRPRTIEKLSLHRAAAHQMGMNPVKLFTDKSLSKDVLRNLQWVRATLPLPGEPAHIHELYQTEQALMLQSIAEAGTEILVKDFCRAYDECKGFERGTALRVFAWLIWNHEIEVEMDGLRIPEQFLPQGGNSQ